MRAAELPGCLQQVKNPLVLGKVSDEQNDPTVFR